MTLKSNIKYIEGKEDLGIEYDWRLLIREYKRLHCPPGYYDPTGVPFTQVKYVMDLSTRSTGKTTNWVLFGMCMNKHYGTIIQYVRSTLEEIMPKYTDKLMATILSYRDGYYIKQLTDGKYNWIKYKSRALYYCFKDEDGNIIETADTEFMHLLSVDEWDKIKSGYNAPTGDLILFDEFIGKHYPPDEFLYFMQVHKSIIRDRLSPICVLLANTINPYSPYFREFEVRKDLTAMKPGDCKKVTTPGGTSIYLELVDVQRKEERRALNSLFYAFSNPGLGAVRGTETVWAEVRVPHIPRTEEDAPVRYLYRNMRIEYEGEFVACELVLHPQIGLCWYVHPSTTIREDTLILTDEDIRDTQHYYGLALHLPIAKRFWEAYKRNLIFYDSNETGSMIKSFVEKFKRI